MSARAAQLALVALAACTPEPLRIALDPTAGRSALLFQLSEAEDRVQAASALDLSVEPGLEPYALEAGERLYLVALYYPEPLSAIGLRAGAQEVAEAGSSLPVPAAESRAELIVDADTSLAVWRPLAATPPPISALRLAADCPKLDGAPLPVSPIALPSGCGLGESAREPLCWSEPRPWPDMFAPEVMGTRHESPGGAATDADGTRWLYLASDALGADGLLYRVPLATSTRTIAARAERIPLPVAEGEPPITGVRVGSVRPDGLEVFFFASQGERHWDETLWVIGRPSTEVPFGAPRRIDGLLVKPFDDPDRSPEGELHFPVLLPDGRTLVYQEYLRLGVAFAERGSSSPGDPSFVRTSQIRLDTMDDYEFVSLSCDRRSLVLVRRDDDPANPRGYLYSARLAPILQLGPLLLGRAAPYEIPGLQALFSGNLTVVEAPGCDALYLGNELGASIAERVPCR